MPENYDFLDDRFIGPTSQAQLNHNRGRDIEDLLDFEGKKLIQANPFALRDPDIARNGRALYEANPVKHILEYHEFLSIRAYTDAFYELINPSLRGGNPGKWSMLEQSADSGLAKLADSSEYGYSDRLTRGLRFTGDEGKVDDIVNRLFPDGGEFSDSSFSSTSYDEKKAFSGNVRVEIEPTTNHAKIDTISVYDDAEAEVLIRPGTKFDVISKNKNPDGSWNIKLREKS